MTEISLQAGVPTLVQLDAPYNVKKYSNAVAVYIGESPLQCKYPLELDDQTILTQDFYAKADSDTTITLTATFSPDIAARLDWMQIKIDENTDGRTLLVARVTQNEQDIVALQGGQQALVNSITTLNSEQTTQDQRILANESDISDLNQAIQNINATVDYATQTETNAGTIDDKSISPKTLQGFWTTNYQSHTNKAVLDKFGQDNNGKPTYNGNTIDTTIAQRDVYNGLDSNDTTISASANIARVLNEYIDSLNTRTGSLENNTQYATTTKSGVVERATDAEAVAGVDTTRYITPSQFQNLLPGASDTTDGVTRRATDAELANGSSNYAYVSAYQLKTVIESRNWELVWSGSTSAPINLSSFYTNDGLYMAKTTGYEFLFSIENGKVLVNYHSAGVLISASEVRLIKLAVSADRLSIEVNVEARDWSGANPIADELDIKEIYRLS